VRGTNRAFTEANPVPSLALNAAGGLATGSVGAKAIGAGANLARNATAARRMLSAARTGAITGGLGSAGAAEGDLEDRAKAGAAGALLGGAFGRRVRALVNSWGALHAQCAMR